MLLPIGAKAQQSDQQQPDKNQSQTQSNDSTQSQPDTSQAAMGCADWGAARAWQPSPKKLNLTDEQKQQFRQIHQQMMKQARTSPTRTVRSRPIRNAIRCSSCASSRTSRCSVS